MLRDKELLLYREIHICFRTAEFIHGCNDMEVTRDKESSLKTVKLHLLGKSDV